MVCLFFANKSRQRWRQETFAVVTEAFFGLGGSRDRASFRSPAKQGFSGDENMAGFQWHE